MKENLQKNAVFLEKNERIEDLQCKDLKIIQNANLYTFTADSVVLANFVKTKKDDLCVEIGGGCGVISILVQAKNKLKKIVAFEIQKSMADLMQKNISLNALQDKLEAICDDVKNFSKYVEKADVVFSNPPYFKVTNFKQNEVKKIAKEEVLLSCKELCECASKMLKSGGVFYVCYPASRTCELVVNLSKNKLAVKEMFFTENGKGKVQTVFLKAVKDAKEEVKVHPNLVTNDENGDYLEALHTKYFC